MLALRGRDLVVCRPRVEEGEVVPARVPELAPRLADGLALVAEVEEELGGGGEEGDDGEDRSGAPGGGGGDDGAGVLRFEGEGGHFPSVGGECAGVVDGAEEPEGLEGGSDCSNRRSGTPIRPHIERYLLVSMSGLSIKSRSSKFCPKHFRLRILDVRLHRRISGSPETAIALNAPSVYSRKQTPLPSRPARPALCIAEDLVMSLVSRVSKPGNVISRNVGCMVLGQTYLHLLVVRGIASPCTSLCQLHT